MKWIRLVLNIVVYLATFYAAMIIHDRVYIKFDAYKDMLDRNGPMWMITVLTTSYVLLLGVFWFKRLFFKSEGLFRMCRFQPISRAAVGWLTVTGILCAVFFVSLIQISFLKSNFPALNEYVEIFMGDSFAITLIGAVVFGVLFEETLFRGLILNELRRTGMPLVAAMIIHALIYAYFQPSLPISCTAFFLAIMYTLIYNRLQSIWATIYTAAIVNSLIFTLRKLGTYDMIAKWNDIVLITIALLSIAGIISVLAILYRSDKRVQITRTEVPV
ncbi:lysostaphin resistance A-like protein [Paenibacillus sp. 2TAB23]|uniref:CPBP family intramembrane glutamic endopeptidase n=1 Tax=Paenibacillus sp. 2TAB23 TaxID=3233004 RepID=UPI003F9D0FA7